MSKTDQYIASALILGVAALLCLSGFGVGVYGLFHGGKAELIFVAAIFGLMGFGAVLGCLVAVRRALA